MNMSLVLHSSSMTSNGLMVSNRMSGWMSYPNLLWTPANSTRSPPEGLEFQKRQRFETCSPPFVPRQRQPLPQYRNLPALSPRLLPIVTPSGRYMYMVFVERVKHIATQVEYGLIPADPSERKYDEKGMLVDNEGMELLSPTVWEDTVKGTFFFAERRPNEANSKYPTLLEQLVTLKVLEIIPTVRCRSIEHQGACLVRILLVDDEVRLSPTSFHRCSCFCVDGTRMFVFPSFASSLRIPRPPTFQSLYGLSSDPV